MRNRDSARFYLWLGFSAVIAVFVVLIGADLTDTTAQSPIPTETFTPMPSGPTNTPAPPTPTDTPAPPTDTPVPPTPTDTPVPPTPTPIPPPPTLTGFTIAPLEGVVQVGAPIDLGITIFHVPPGTDLDLVEFAWGDGTVSSCLPESEECEVAYGIVTIMVCPDDPSSLDCPDDDKVPRDVYGAEVTGRHTYSEPGVYTVNLTVRDQFGQFGTSTFEFVIVYDPDGGFVTGGGWIDSQAGAYKPDETLSGKATFGFVSKYKRGSSRPTGNTVFQFKVADLDFQSDTYDWLVITGSDHARFKGSGTINGLQSPGGVDYRFMLWAGDDEPDTFRIKIWYELGDLEYVIYDNGMDQEIGGGSVVVHTK